LGANEFSLTADEVAYLARVSGATAMICGREFPEHARGATGSAPSINLVVSIGASPFGDDYETIVGEHQGRVAPDTAVEHDDPCWFFWVNLKPHFIGITLIVSHFFRIVSHWLFPFWTAQLHFAQAASD
jgi:hypothetical protein